MATADPCPVFRYFPRWPDMESDLRAAVALRDLPNLIEMLERRDVELEQWLEHCVGGATTGPVGIKRGDLYDDFTSETEDPPPKAETGQIWTPSATSFTTVYQQGLFVSSAGEGVLTADSLKADARVRARLVTSSGRISCGLVFRCSGTGGPYLSIWFENSDGGGGGGGHISLSNWRYGEYQRSSVVLLPSQIYDIDLTYKGTQITCFLNGAPAINYNVATGLEANTRVGFRQSNTGYGAFGDGNDFMSYIWATDAP